MHDSNRNFPFSLGTDAPAMPPIANGAYCIHLHLTPENGFRTPIPLKKKSEIMQNNPMRGACGGGYIL
jgi:hypothetical protein